MTAAAWITLGSVPLYVGILVLNLWTYRLMLGNARIAETVLSHERRLSQLENHIVEDFTS